MIVAMHISNDNITYQAW